MIVLDSTTRAYRLNGDTISEASLDTVLNAAYAMLANNDEIVPQFVLHVTSLQTLFGKDTGTQLAECARRTHGYDPQKKCLCGLYAAGRPHGDRAHQVPSGGKCFC